MLWAALVALAALIASACAQETPVLGWSGYTEHQYLLNATERQAVSDVVEFGVQYAAKRADSKATPVVMRVSRQPLYFDRWTNDTLSRYFSDGQQSFQKPIVFGALYHITMVELEDNGRSDTFFEVTLHRDRNKRLTVTRFSIAKQQAQAPPERSTASTSRLSVLSWNLWNYNRPWRDRLDLLVAEVTKQSPHVIGFQEVRYDPGASPFPDRWFQVEHLAQRLPQYQFVYQPAMLYLDPYGDPPGHVDEGLAVFSLYPIVEVSYLRLTRDRTDREDDHQRIVLRALIRTPQGDLNFYVTHLSLSLEARRRTAPEVWNFVQTHGKAGIIVGDFNEEPEGPLVTHLVGNGGDFVDTWVRAHPGDIGYTFSSDRPRKRIDFLLARCPGSVLEVHGARIIGNQSTVRNNELIWPSDHYGLVVDLACTPPPVEPESKGWVYVLSVCVGLALLVMLSDVAKCYLAIMGV